MCGHGVGGAPLRRSAYAVAADPATTPMPTRPAPTAAGDSGVTTSDESTRAAGSPVTPTSSPPGPVDGAPRPPRVHSAVHAAQNSRYRTTSWVQISTARMPANGPAVALP